MCACRLPRASGGGCCCHAASISESIGTVRFRLINNNASTARCFAAPGSTSAPLALICNGPNTPNWSALWVIAVAIPSARQWFRTFQDPIVKT